ncbi:TPA: glycosyltransferase family 4 protein [Providencia alcalifaciens]
MNILFLCSEYPPFPNGGIGTFTKELATELVKNGHKIYVIGNYPVQKKEIDVIDGVEVIKIKKSKGILGQIINRLRMLFTIKKIINHRQIDILEVSDFGGPLAFYPKLDCKIVTRLHGSVFYFKKLTNTLTFKDKLWKLIEKSSIKKSNRIISVSQFTANYTKEIFNLEKNIKTIHNGIAINTPYIKKEHFDHVIKYIFAGSILKKKGILELIDAWLEFEKGKSNVELFIYGKNIEGLVDIIKAKLEKSNCISIQINSPLPKSALIEIYEKMDFCIFPSKAEAFSLAPMEAMAMSKVVLYTNQTSASEIIKNDFNGVIIPQCTVKDILSSLNYAYNMDIAKYNLISKNAYLTIKNNFNVVDKNKQNSLFYEEVISYEN